MTRTLPRIAAIAFILFFIAICVIADRGEGSGWWGFLDHIPQGDKLGHLVLIGTMAFLCNLAIPTKPRPWLPRFITLTTLVLLVLLSLDEVAQAFISTRTCDIFDWLADLVGLALGQTAAARISS
ncbi:MAG: VanZ family protein [Verrucomicrobiota bacterium]